MSVFDDMGGEIMLVFSQRVCRSVFLDMDDDMLLAFIHSVDHKQGASVSGDHELTT